MKYVTGTFALILLVVAIGTSIALFIGSWHLNQDIYGWMERAQVSNEPHDMVTYLTNVKQGMEKWNMTEGNAAFFFPSPSSDMTLIYMAVEQDIDQAKILESMDKSSPQYAINLDNLRGAIRELTIPAYEYWANHGSGFPIAIFCWIGWVGFLVFGVWWVIVFMNS